MSRERLLVQAKKNYSCVANYHSPPKSHHDDVTFMLMRSLVIILGLIRKVSCDWLTGAAAAE